MKKLIEMKINQKWILWGVFSGIFLLISTEAIGQILPSEMFGQEGVKDSTSDPIDFFSFQVNHFNLDFFVRLGINVLTMVVLLRLIYFKVYRRHDYFFTFFMFNLVIFIVAVLLNADDGFSIGAAFGLFAIFAMLRYRSENIAATDMTYLFISITFGLVSAINMGTWVEIVIINSIILLAAYLISGNLLFKPEFSKSVEYENIDLVKPGNNDELIADLKSRTGLNIHKVYIKKIDYLRDMAQLKIYYHSSDNRDV